MAIFWCVMWLPGLVLDVGVDTKLGSVEDVGSDEERDESEGGDEKGDEVDDPCGRGSVCAATEDNSDDEDDAAEISPAEFITLAAAPAAPTTSGLSI